MNYLIQPFNVDNIPDDGDFQVTGPYEGNEQIKEMIIFYKKGSNLFDYLLSLPLDDLRVMGSYPDTRDEKCFQKIIIIVTISLALQNPGSSFHSEQIPDSIGAFCTMCLLAAFQKEGLNEIDDPGRWWEKDGDLKIKLTDKFMDLTSGMWPEKGATHE